MARSNDPGSRTLVLTPRRLFILFGLAAALAIVAFRTETLLQDRARLLEQRQGQAQQLAQFAATYTEGLYNESSRLAAEISQFVRDQSPTPQQLHAYLVGRAADTTANDYMVVLDARGRVIATSEDAIAPAMDYGGPDFEATVRDARRRVEPVMRSRLTGSVIYSLSNRLEDRNGRFVGVVGVNVRPEGIQPTGRRRPADPLLSVWDHQGRFIAASFVDFDAGGRAIAPRKPAGLGIAGAPGAGDDGVIASAMPVTGWPLVAAAAFDKRGVLQPWWKEVYENAGLVGAALAVIALLVWLGVMTAEREERAKRASIEASERADAALAARDLMMKEVHHRVKNSLLMTAGLIRLQQRQFDDPAVREAFESMQQRLYSIGLVHEALYSGSSLEELDIHDYFTRLLKEVAAAHGADARGIKVVGEIEPIMLKASQTTPAGLIVAEAVTNAFKHAFAPDQGGTITVRARLLGADDIEIEIRDDGAGYGQPTGDRQGLGSRIIAAMCDQLGGVISFANEGGAALRVTFSRSGYPVAQDKTPAEAERPARPKRPPGNLRAVRR